VLTAGIAACAGVAALAMVVRDILPLGDTYVLKASGLMLAVTIVAAAFVREHHPFARLGAANQVTLVRAALVALVAGLIGEPPIPAAAAAATGLAVLVELLDGVDGWLARRGAVASAFGARLDMEIDALLILVLATLAWQHGKAGGWVLLSGLMRYAFVAAGWLLPWLARPLPSSRRRQAICVLQIVCLCAAVSPVLAPRASAPISAIALAALSASFLVDVVWLQRERQARPTSARAPAFPFSS
jgi:phosphatidylglycerophosphate synthase